MYGSRMLKPACAKGDELADSVHPGSSGQRLQQPAQCRDRHLRRTGIPTTLIGPDGIATLYRYSDNFKEVVTGYFNQ